MGIEYGQDRFPWQSSTRRMTVKKPSSGANFGLKSWLSHLLVDGWGRQVLNLVPLNSLICEMQITQTFDAEYWIKIFKNLKHRDQAGWSKSSFRHALGSRTRKAMWNFLLRALNGSFWGLILKAIERCQTLSHQFLFMWLQSNI